MSDFMVKHGKNSLAFRGSFLFTKSGFSNAVIDHRGETERNTVTVSSGVFKALQSNHTICPINIVFALFSLVTSSIIIILNYS